MKYSKRSKIQKHILLISLALLLSCNKKHIQSITYFDSGNIESIKNYDSDNNLIQIISYYDSIDKKILKREDKNKAYDSISVYYDNGKLFKQGKKTSDGLKFGNWNRYTREGFLSDTREYFRIKDDYVLNRKFYFNKKGDTVWYAKKFNRYNQKEFIGDTLKSRNSDMNLFDFYDFKDTLSLDEPFAASVRCNSPLARNYNSEIMMLLAKEKYNFDSIYSNEKEVILDTFYNLNKDVTNKINFPKANPNYVVVFGRWFDTPGEKVLRGYMLEYFTRDPENFDSISKGERRVYFEKKIYIKDTNK